jgi:Methyltransferase domain
LSSLSFFRNGKPNYLTKIKIFNLSLTKIEINMTQRLNRIIAPLKSKILAAILPNGYYFSKKGYCPCCQQNVLFEAYHDWFRDNLLCNNPQCRSVPRERALMLMINKYDPNWRNLKIHESSPIDRGASMLLKNECANYHASQYYPNHAFGSKIDGFRNEDLENQTFENEVFDLVISQDVMEHIYDPAKAFSEIARTLKPGGAHIFSVPIENRHTPSEIWAVKASDGGGG